MKYLVTAEEMRNYDANTMDENKIGIPGMVLMERAAMAAADIVKRALEQTDVKTVFILAGVGNNGGDGLALARILTEQGIPVEIYSVGNPAKASEQWKLQKQILDHLGVKLSDSFPVQKEYGVCVDALFGIGLSRAVTGEFAEAVALFNGLCGYKLSLDIPSGIHADTGQICQTAVRARETVTFGFVKRGLVLYPGAEYAGKITVADIGISEKSFCGKVPEMICLDRQLLKEIFPLRPREGNKGTFGKVLLVAGKEGMAGAAVLCAKACLRTGAGMVKILSPEENRVILQTAVPEALLGNYEEFTEDMDWADVLVVGPGIGKNFKAGQMLARALRRTDKPIVLDADALNILAEDPTLKIDMEKHADNMILTPHVGEFSRLIKKSIEECRERLSEEAREYAAQIHATVVAKDARTFVCAENHPVFMNLYGNCGMATAGSGDVLTGIIAGIWAQRRGTGQPAQEAFRVACMGVSLHAVAGDLVAEEISEFGCVAGDLIEKIGAAYLKIQSGEIVKC